MRTNIVIISQKNSIFAGDLWICKIQIDQIPSLKRLKRVLNQVPDLVVRAVRE